MTGIEEMKDGQNNLMQKVNRKDVETKRKIIEYFGKESWENVEGEEKGNHSLVKCPICFKKYKKSLSLLCMNNKKDRLGNKKAMKCGLILRSKVSYEEVSSAANEAMVRLNEEFKEKYNTSFEATVVKLKNLENKKSQKDLSKRIKRDIENKWKETSVLRFVTTSFIKTF